MLFKNRKILIISLTRHGSHDYTFEMARALKTYDPILVLSAQSRHSSADKVLTITTYRPNAVSFLWHSMTAILRVPWHLWRWQRSYGPLMLYFPVFHSWNLYFILWARMLNIPVTLTVHDVTTHPGEENRLIENLQYASMKRADRVVFLSEAERKKAASRIVGLDERSVVLTHPLLETGTDNNLPYNPRPAVLCLGRGVDYQGFDIMARMASGLPVARVTIAGENAGKYHTGGENLEIIDRYLDPEDIRSLMSRHEILVLPYRSASQSGILAMGVAAGMVMVVTRVGGLPEQVPDDVAHWVDPDPASIEEGLSALIKSKDLYDHYKKNIRQFRTTYRSQWQTEVIRFVEGG